MRALWRAIERPGSVATSYCGRLLGVMGAEVIKVEPPTGDPLRFTPPGLRTVDGEATSALFEYLNAFKRGVTVDPCAPEGAEALRRLLAVADIVIDRVDGDPDRARAEYEAAREVNPKLVYVAISGFGLTGPYREYRSNDFIDFASGGYTFVTGETDREPLQGGGPWAGYVAGLNAAIGGLAALRQARETGKGNLVDVSAMESMWAAHQWSVVRYTHQGYVKRRAGNRHAESYNPMGPVRCKDGWVCLAVSSAQMWENFCINLDRPELLADERFQTGGGRFQHAEEFAAELEPTLMDFTVDELVERCVAGAIPAAGVLTVPEALEEPQLEARGFWVGDEQLGERARMPGRPFRLPGVDAPFRPAPGVGEANAEVLGDSEATVGGGR